MMSITGDAKSAPLRVGYRPPTHQRDHRGVRVASAWCGPRHGEGAFIDVSMLDSALVTMGWVISNYLIAGVEPQAHGNDNFTAAPSGAFRTKDGLLNIAANKQEQFEALVKAIGSDELATDPRFAKRESRKKHRHALTEALERSLAAKGAAEWQTILTRLGIPAGRVATVPEALQSEQVATRELLQTFPSEASGVDRPITVAKPAQDATETRSGDVAAAARAHTLEVLTDLGYTQPEIECLRQQGAI